MLPLSPRPMRKLESRKVVSIAPRGDRTFNGSLVCSGPSACARKRSGCASSAKHLTRPARRTETRCSSEDGMPRTSWNSSNTTSRRVLLTGVASPPTTIFALMPPSRNEASLATRPRAKSIVCRLPSALTVPAAKLPPAVAHQQLWVQLCTGTCTPHLRVACVS